MDIGLALTFVFQDPDWLKKVLINALIGLIPVVGQLYLLGWGLEVSRRVALDEYTALPEMDFGTFLKRGFQVTVAGIVYSLPIWIFALPMVIIPAAGAAVGIEEDAIAAFAAILSLCCGGLIFIYAIFLGLMMQVTYAHVAVEDSLSAAFQISEILRLFRVAIGPWLMAFVGTIVASLLASLVGSLACGIVVIFTMAIYFPVMGHLYGQAYRQARMAPVLN